MVTKRTLVFGALALVTLLAVAATVLVRRDVAEGAWTTSELGAEKPAAATGKDHGGSGEIDGFSGGADAVIGDVPFVGELAVGGAFLCTAALISPSVIISAGHCLDGDTANLTVRLGMSSDGTGGTVFPLQGAPIMIYGADMALVRLKQPAPYQPVELAETTPGDGTAATLIGWERPVLRQLEVTVQSNLSQCDRAREIDSLGLCSEASRGVGGAVRRSSEGDSGGPMLARAADGSWRLAGVMVGYVGSGNFHGGVASRREILLRLTDAMADETCAATSAVQRVEDLSCVYGVPAPPGTLRLKVVQKGWFEAWVVVYNQANEVVCSHEHLWLGAEVELTCPIGEGPFVISGGARLGRYESWPYSAREPRLCMRFDGPFFDAHFKPIKC